MCGSTGKMSFGCIKGFVEISYAIRKLKSSHFMSKWTNMSGQMRIQLKNTTEFCFDEQHFAFALSVQLFYVVWYHLASFKPIDKSML